MSCEMISKVRIHDGDTVPLVVKGTGAGSKQVEVLSGNSQSPGDGFVSKGASQFRIGKHNVAANSISDGRRLGDRQLGKMPTWLTERRFNTQARNWKGKAVMGASENTGGEDALVEIVKVVVTGKEEVVAKDKGLSILATENLVCSENLLIEGTDESPYPAILQRENREDVPSTVIPNMTIPGVGPTSLGPILKPARMDDGLSNMGNPTNLCADPVGATRPSPEVQKLLREMAAISPFFFGLNSPPAVKNPRKWKKTARANSKYTFEALASQSNLKDGRKRGTVVSTQEAAGSSVFKRTRDNTAANFQSEAGMGNQAAPEARRADGGDANDATAIPNIDLMPHNIVVAASNLMQQMKESEPARAASTLST
ncbi:hypothetical protein COLO4_38068 [Corchorus olitorius]|uniref:Uncharacterized protein n=1 Tax=Corchorus olitorius TaxID=93759 RepID=A0A1R3FX89_9ROSI|nr:hypothetical protein COLO4_38068 [Corchorus olitorius]